LNIVEKEGLSFGYLLKTNFSEEEDK